MTEIKKLGSLDISGNIDIDQLPKSLKTLENFTSISMRSTSIRSMCNINFIIDHKFDDGDIRQNRRTWIDGYDKDNFTKKGVSLYELYYNCGFNNRSRSNGDVENVGIYYSKTPIELALQLCDNPDQNPESDNLSEVLTGDERERLVHEVTWRERDVLEKFLDPLHPILLEINNEKRFKIKLKNGSTLRR